ncbi:MAG: ABC transporter permease [Firmicutes bacterium]|nr:ABC transporter permease [Bacillota bacterium]MCL5039219.1 ABC transporter permease [Bacillota bacterium]
MAAYVARRLLAIVPVLLGISVVVFLVMHLIPGDPIVVMLGEKAPPEKVEEMRRELGLNDPLYVQYGRFLLRALQGDLGRSIRTQERVAKEIAGRLPATLELTFSALLLATFFGVLLGVIASTKQHSLWDNLSMVLAVAGVSMPVFWLGLMLIFLFGVDLRWLPFSGRLSTGVFLESVTGLNLFDALLTGNAAAFWDALRHLVLPSFTLGVVQMAIIARMTRSSMLEVVRQDYVRTARAKGLSQKTVIYKHALKNALIPVVTVIGLTVGRLLGGAVLVETVFSWPGLGKLAIDAIYARDYPQIQGVVLLIASGFVLVNLVVDLSYALLDPRIRYQ